MPQFLPQECADGATWLEHAESFPCNQLVKLQSSSKRGKFENDFRIGIDEVAMISQSLDILPSHFATNKVLN